MIIARPTQFIYQDQELIGIRIGKELKLEKSHRISMKTSKEVNEKWLQDQIANDPSILNLGEIFLKDFRLASHNLLPRELPDQWNLT